MARRVIFGVVRQFLDRYKRIATTFASHAGETTSIVTTRDRCHYEKLTTSRKPGEFAPRNPKTLGRVPQHVVEPRFAAQSSRRESNFADRAPRIRSRVKIMVRKVRDAMRRFRETARASNLQACDLFPGTRMLAPVSRTKSNAKHYYPSPGLGRPSIAPNPSPPSGNDDSPSLSSSP